MTNFEYHKKSTIDWSTIPVDTLIYVSDNGRDWVPRYFAEYDNNKVYAWVNGATSLTAFRSCTNDWKYFRLPTKEEYKEPTVDWSKVPVDTKILVKCCAIDDWERRYFAKYDKETNEVYSFADGATSWSAGDEPVYISWNYVKLAEEADKNE